MGESPPKERTQIMNRNLPYWQVGEGIWGRERGGQQEQRPEMGKEFRLFQEQVAQNDWYIYFILPGNFIHFIKMFIFLMGRIKPNKIYFPGFRRITIYFLSRWHSIRISSIKSFHVFHKCSLFGEKYTYLIFLHSIVIIAICFPAVLEKF